MKFIQGNDRDQTHLFPVSLEQSIDPDNQVRIIDLFVDSLPLDEFGFRTDFVEKGRPAYHPSDLLKLYIYGYMNKVRSSRDLEKECKRNIEVMWLLKCLQPDHNTISNFRRDNPKSIKKVFRATVQIAKNFNLIGGRLIAGDSTKLRAQNSKKNNFNQKKINRHIAFIDNKLDHYNKQLAEQDGDNKEQIKKEIEKHNKRKDDYQSLENQLKETGESQISTSDPESRHMVVPGRINEVVYNVQSTVDAKHNLPIDYKVTNTIDTSAMGNMLRRAKSILATNDFIGLYDKGYHTGAEFKIAHDLDIDVLVAIPEPNSQAPNPNYNLENFSYHQDGDYYTCPQGHKLFTNGNWYNKSSYRFKKYSTNVCKCCPVKDQCSKAKSGKDIYRSEYQEYIDKNKERIEQNQEYYKQRQAIVEHPFGTIKRQWGFNYVLTKKFKCRASADVGLMFTAYNLRRIINILGIENLKKYLKSTVFCLSGIYQHIWLDFVRSKRFNFQSQFRWQFSNMPLNKFIFDYNLIKSEVY